MLGLRPTASAALSGLIDDEELSIGSGAGAVGIALALALAASVGVATGEATAEGLAGTNAYGEAFAIGRSASVGQAIGEATVAGSPVGNYLPYAQIVTAVPQLADDIKSDFTTAGELRQRAMYPAAKRDFTLRHLLTTAEMADLRAFYALNRTTRFALVWDGDGNSYNVRFAGPISEKFDNGWWHAEVMLREV